MGYCGHYNGLTHECLCWQLIDHGDFPRGSVVKNSPANAGDTGSIPGSGRSPGEGNGNPLQYSCLGNPMDRGAQGATLPGVAKERLNNNKLIIDHMIPRTLTK